MESDATGRLRQHGRVQLRDELRRKVANAFLHPGRGRVVGYRDLQGADYRRLVLQMLDCLDKKIRDVEQEIELAVERIQCVWEFPPDPRVEYESTDEDWARPLGFGREIILRDAET
jgi:hypothetical protein